jgi:AAA family ATP:ADP antiporter
MYSLFVASVFWSVMADAFRSGQAKRLFGFIGVGGTLGAIAGSAATALLARSLGPVNLLLVSLALLELTAALAFAFYAAAPAAATSRRADEEDASAAAAAAAVDDVARAHRAPGARPARAIGGSAWAGITHISRSPYLLGIAVFLVLYTFGSTVLYFAQTEIVGATLTDRAARTELLARMELATQILTAVTQAFFTGRIIRRVGLAAALAFVPAVSVLGFAAIGATSWGLAPALATIVGFSVLRRASNYALTNPAMEALFTVVSREDKYKAKSFIETFVYRAGDQLAAWGYAGLAALGLGVAGISWITVPFSAAFLALGVWLGRRQRELAHVRGPSGLPDHPPAVTAPVTA